MATELLRRLGHARGRALSAAVDTAFCLYVYRDFTGGVGRCCLSETHPQRWLGPSLHAGMGYASAASNMATSSKIPRPFLSQAQQRSLHTSFIQCSSSTSPKEKSSEQKKQAHDSIVYSEEEAGDLSDKVAPVSRPEAAGWSFVIVAAYGITAFLIYTVYTSIIVEAPEDKVFNQALEAVRKDFRVTSILGSTIKGYGGSAAGRRGRQRIANDTYTDSSNVQHTQVQFLVAGSGKRGVVSADMYMRDGEWHYSYLFVDIEGDRFVLKPVGSSFAPN